MRVIAQAEGDASRFVQVLTEYEKAPDVTRERLYLETVESVLANSSKVMIDVPGGNNLLYLPLDKIIDSARKDSNVRGGSLPDSQRAIPRNFDSDRRGRGSDGRTR